jgi:hypothetical protein
MCHDKREFIRQIYHAQNDAPDWQVGWIRENHTGMYPANKKANFPMKIAPKIVDKDIANALENFINLGFTPINPPIMGKFVELELLEKD